ncbi:hypothetical protein EBZ80_19350, partial [bacterium]|nr:hypothetical protein [bacterium]
MAYEKSKVSSFGGGSLDSTPVVGFEYCHQFSRIAGEVPDASTLGEGEIAINLADGILYIRGANGSVVAAGGVAGGSAANQVVSPGGISNLTTAQQGEIVVGTIVTTTDGRRWVYKGQGSKTLEASYIELADITPAWSAISDKPSTFTPSSHSHSISDVTGLQTAIDQKVSSAPQWTQSHTSENGTQYAVNDVVYAGGNIYRAIAANDSIEVTNPSYWTLVGAGYRINISGADIDGLPSQLPSSANDGDVLTYDTNLGYWVAEAPGGGGGGGDYLPLTGGTMTGNIAFDGTSGQAIGKGWFDSNRGGNYGISLYCSIGYQLNWQAGWLSTTEQDLATRRPLYLDSAAGTTLRAWDASENKGVEVSHINIAFADGTTQGSAGIIAPQGSMTDGYVLTWSDSSSAWIAAAPSGGGGASLPSGSNTGDLLTYDSSTASWVASSLANVLPTTGVDGTVMMWNSGTWTAASIPSQLPTSASNNDVLAWNGSSWVAVMPSTPGLPSASSGQYLTFNGSNWVAGSSPLPNGTADGETLYWNTATSTWSSAPVLLPDWNAQVGYAVGQLAAYDGRLWRATNTGMGNTPADGSGYWTAITASSSLPAGSDGNVLTYDSGASAWIAAAPVAELPEAPG